MSRATRRVLNHMGGSFQRPGLLDSCVMLALLAWAIFGTAFVIWIAIVGEWSR